jgi:hypothetical protein
MALGDVRYVLAARHTVPEARALSDTIRLRPAAPAAAANTAGYR